MTPASRDSWKTLPLPAERMPLDFQARYSPEEWERIQRRHIPEFMGDHWFLFVEGDWLYVHRSWTGAAIYGVRFVCDADGASRVAECWVSRDRRLYTGDNPAEERETLAFIITELLLTQREPYPGWL